MGASYHCFIAGLVSSIRSVDFPNEIVVYANETSILLASPSNKHLCYCTTKTPILTVLLTSCLRF